ncbi:hypothetical protein MIB92_06615 [Aestuariirhabdus sp. Z084]|uniref:cell division inhibitor SulA n=1 Tax=Aestuariirhabdus haliotis TaxID=2918751 RepID=UPI00201B3E02|nr:SulA-like leucine-rich domain-containing protein [Aestuariirhabdus haliotis]MCL6415316.1 hypothetical protein [Aestuariirhabdus haliotis]MCL6419072.1 hypothetical protein [Aestuariirhabdus haliotis]
MQSNKNFNDAVGWSENGRGAVRSEVVTSGYDVLDTRLVGGGWSRGAVTDLQCDLDSSQELALLLPVLASLTRQEERWVLWVAPPKAPCASILRAAGVDVSRVLVLHTEWVDDVVGIMERALTSGRYSAVLGWPKSANYNHAKLREAASRGGSFCMLLREPGSDSITDVDLSMKVTKACDGVAVEIMRQYGGWVVPRFVLNLESRNAVGSPSGDIVRGPWQGTLI